MNISFFEWNLNLQPVQLHACGSKPRLGSKYFCFSNLHPTNFLYILFTSMSQNHLWNFHEIENESTRKMKCFKEWLNFLSLYNVPQKVPFRFWFRSDDKVILKRFRSSRSRILNTVSCSPEQSKQRLYNRRYSYIFLCICLGNTSYNSKYVTILINKIKDNFCLIIFNTLGIRKAAALELN